MFPPERKEGHSCKELIECDMLLFFVVLQAMKAFIEANFKMIDIDGDGIVGAKEYRYNCITRIAVENIQVVDDAYNKLLDVSAVSPQLTHFFSFFRNHFFLTNVLMVISPQDEDRRRGGLTLQRYQELYGHYLGNTDEGHPAVHLFGPLSL